MPQLRKNCEQCGDRAVALCEVQVMSAGRTRDHARYLPLVCGAQTCSGALCARYITEGVNALRAGLGRNRKKTTPNSYSATHALTPLRTYCAPRA